MYDHIQNFENFFSTELNAQQQDIVQRKSGVLLVCAGAGSGKTRIITARMTSLMLHHKVPASHIIALTFTNKAAQEMRERMTTFVGAGNLLPTIGTFHSYCLRLLKSNNHALTIKNFSIMDDDDQEKLLKLILTRHGVHKKITSKHLAALISHLKNEAITGELPWKLINDPFLETLIRAYEKEKAASHCYDFDDLLLETLRLAHTNHYFLETYQQHIRHVLVDEYQDTNKVQHALLQALTCRSSEFALDSLCVVGDEDQSIYSWRGATIRNIVYFKKDFPTVIPFTIEQNYRSVKPILDLANNIIIHNKERNPKNLWSDRVAHDRIRLLSCISGYHEADCIIQIIQLYRIKYPQESCAILYRSHYQSRVLEEALLKEGITYRIIGGIQFYERQEIKDLLAYLRLIANPFDRISFSRIYHVPSRGLGEKFLEQFLKEWEQQPFLSWDTIAQELITKKSITGSKAQAVEAFITLMSKYQPWDKPSTVLESLTNSLSYLSYLKENFDEEAESKIENVKELIHAVRSAEDRSPTLTLTAFLEEVTLLQQAYDHKEQENCIQLMTLHAAKGLEFDIVILAGLEEQILPSMHALATGELEEERRLLYVGITRAREWLLLTHARYRHTYGSMVEHRISRFMQEVDHYIKPTDATQWGACHIKAFAYDWLNQKTIPAPLQQQDQSKSTASRARWSEDPFEETIPQWRLKQKVKHASFGTGFIEKIEAKGKDKIFLTIKFGHERKRIDAKFVQEI